MCRIVAYTSGSESYQDKNGNGKYDGEEVDAFITTSDMSEPYIDANDSGSYDAGELYIDSNGDGEFTAANEVFDAKTTIWTSLNITFSSGIALDLGAEKEGWVLDCQESKDFSFIVSDFYGNTPIDGTTYEINITKNKADEDSNPKSPLVDLTGASKTVNFTLTPNSETTPGEIEITVIATLPDGTRVSDVYKGEITGICPIARWSGTGNDDTYTKPFDLIDTSNVFFPMTHDGSSNFIVHLKNYDTGNIVEYLVNEIGEYDGTVNESLDKGEYYFDVTADGKWTIDMSIK